MVVVSDTSPLNYLVLIGCHDVLPALFGRVLTAPAVIAEMRHQRSPQVVQAWAAAPPAWLEVQTPARVERVPTLGKGEAEAISLALQVRADAVLIDERAATAAARNFGLFVTGTLGVLSIAHEKSLLEIESAVSELQRTSFRASDAVYRSVVDQAKLARERRSTG